MMLTIEMAIATLLYDLPIKDHKELQTLITNVYHEASGEGPVGMNAVAHVTLNRVDSRRYPSTIYKVVHQTEQFSWTLESHSKPIIIENMIDYIALEDAVTISAMAYNGLTIDPTGGALHYINPFKADPDWTDGAKVSYTYLNHTFYIGVK